MRRRSRPGRPGLLTLIEPTPAELASLARADFVGLLARVELLAKQLHRRPDHTVPKVVSQLLYTIASVLAVMPVKWACIRSAMALAGNIHWFLEQTWLDKRVTRFSRPAENAGWPFRHRQSCRTPA